MATATFLSLEQLDADIQRVEQGLSGVRLQLQQLEEEHAWLTSTRESFVRYMEKYASGTTAAPPPGATGNGAARPDVDARLSAVEWAERALSKLAAGDLQDTWALIHLMEKEGYQSSADKLYLTVYGTLNRAEKRSNSAVVKVGSKWGLRAWYPDGVPAAPGLDLSVFEEGDKSDAD